jgi:hypothetical protein
MCHLGIVRFMSILMMLFAVGCAAKRVGSEGQGTAFPHKTVALMKVPTAQGAESLRQSLLRGEFLPPTAEVISMNQLERMSTALGKVADGLGDCQVSQPIPMAENSTGNGYIVLQKGGDSEGACWEKERNSPGFFQEMDEKIGELFMGLLVVGLTGLLIALPFILHH